jgi:hypothetical protein
MQNKSSMDRGIKTLPPKAKRPAGIELTDYFKSKRDTLKSRRFIWTAAHYVTMEPTTGHRDPVTHAGHDG